MTPASPQEASKALVTRFFTEVWNAPYRMETIDELLSEDFIITNAGHDIPSRDNFKKWVSGLASQFKDLKVEIKEMIVADNGQRVVTRMVASGRNNGVFGTQADDAPVSMTIISIVAIKDGKIVHNWVEKSAFEVFHKLSSEQKRV